VIVVDTTILAYAIGGDHPLKSPSQRFMDRVSLGAIAATTTAEVIQEFAHIRARRFARTEVAGAARRYAAVLDPLIVVTAAALHRGLVLFERHEQLGAFDAVLAATAIEHGADALVSADTAFAGVRGLRHAAPGTPAFERLIGA
jgi:uncharacterized protein